MDEELLQHPLRLSPLFVRTQLSNNRNYAAFFVKKDGTKKCLPCVSLRGSRWLRRRRYFHKVEVGEALPDYDVPSLSATVCDYLSLRQLDEMGIPKKGGDVQFSHREFGHRFACKHAAVSAV